MHGHDDRSVSDEALAREIEAALGVDPSPGFLPRIRARVAGQDVRHSWLWSAPWRWAGAAAVVSAVATLVVWTLREPEPASREARVDDAGVDVLRPAPEPVAPLVEPSKPAGPSAVRAAYTPRRAAVAPERVVVTSPDEAAALRQLVTAISARQVKAVDIPALGVESAPLPPIEEIVLEPIKLSPMAGLEGE
jgi:hypothetical protein